MLNYDTLAPGGKKYSFPELYAPFKRKALFRSGIPVMVAEGGSLSESGQRQWMEEAARAMVGSCREIQAFVLFNSGYDKNVPPGAEVSQIDWRLRDAGEFFRITKGAMKAKAAPARSLKFVQPGKAVARSVGRIRFAGCNTRKAETGSEICIRSPVRKCWMISGKCGRWGEYRTALWPRRIRPQHFRGGRRNGDGIALRLLAATGGRCAHRSRIVAKEDRRDHC